jgi:hypothetical protein
MRCGTTGHATAAITSPDPVQVLEGKLIQVLEGHAREASVSV